MGNFSSLLFELSSSDRLDILMLLKKAPLRLSHISAKLNFTVQETSRNITRLSEAKLIVKSVDGEFHLTPYGQEALNMLFAYRFLYRNREYLTTHILSELPKHFRASVGILDDFQFIGDVMTTFHNIENMIAKAQKYVLILTNQVLASTIPHLMQALEREVEFKLLMPKDFLPSNEIRELVTNPAFHKANLSRKLENRFLERIDVFLCLSEQEVASLAFPNLEGKLDYIGFRAEKDFAVEWSKELFMYYWNRASTHVPEQLINLQEK